MKVFLSHSFRNEERDLVARVDTLLSSHDVPIITGRRLGGEQLTAEVTQRIEGADALVALMTRRDQIGEPGAGQWRTHPWVESELAHARAHDKLTIALVEGGVQVGGAYSESERIALDPSEPLDALLSLSETVRVWKEQLGVARRIQLKPDEIGTELRTTPGLTCRYRFVTPQGSRTDWRPAEPITQSGGTILYLDGVGGDDYYIEIEVLRGDAMQWWSPATAQLINVDLQPRDGS
jgi:hypothetical protein